MDVATVQKNSRGRRLGEGRRFTRLPSFGASVTIWLILVFPLLTLTGCGIDQNLVYYSPPGFVPGGGNIVTLTHNSSNVDSFLGYDIYYRAYSILNDADSARVAIENASNLTTATPEGVLSQLTSKGFKKIYLASNPSVSPTPLLSGATTYTIQILQATNWYYTSDVASTQNYLIRGIGSLGKSFNDTYLAADPDTSTASDLVTGSTIYIVAFAVAYGYDFTKLTSIYSLPASLYQEIVFTLL